MDGPFAFTTHRKPVRPRNVAEDLAASIEALAAELTRAASLQEALSRLPRHPFAQWRWFPPPSARRRRRDEPCELIRIALAAGDGHPQQLAAGLVQLAADLRVGDR